MTAAFSNRTAEHGAGVTLPDAPDRSELTEVDLIWIESRHEDWLRFGHAVDTRIIDAARRVLFFPAGTIFALVRWAANEYGTVLSRLDILQAVPPGAPCQSIPCVRPGAASLLRVDSWPKVERVLQAIDAIEAQGIDPTEVSSDHWRHLHHRIAAGMPPHGYDAVRHHAWLKRREIMP
jgi:hypothetical protein